MTKPVSVDFIIVGQGLAGSVLAHRLIEYGQSVIVIDNRHQHSSSVIAAGIINPISGHRLNLTEGFKTYYPAAEQTYAKMQQQLRINIWQPLEQVRLIRNPGQLSYYHQRINDSAFGESFSPLEYQSDYFRNMSFGATYITPSAMVDTHALLKGVRSWLSQQSALISARADYSSIVKKNENSLELNGVNATSIVFCEGHQAIHNPWLADLPFKLSKGAVLTVETDTLITRLLNWGQWLLPDPQGARLGSNFDWNNLSSEPDSGAEEKLLDSLHNITTIRAKTLQHKTGIRPTTVLRKPFVGPVSGLNNAYCFNGFGSKGCLLIPYYAELLCQHLLHQVPLPAEVSRCL